MINTPIRCRSCQRPFDLHTFPYRCPACGGLFGFVDGLAYQPPDATGKKPGIWRYQESLALPAGAPVLSLGEGNTPLVWTELFGQRVGLKLESLNPTGSFKDRGAAVLVSWLAAAGLENAVEDSSGNAGAAFAAYAARAGIGGRVFIPASASGPKRTQIESCGVDVIPVPGPRSGAADAVLEAVNQGAVYASHAYLPQGTAGIATIAYELVEQLGSPPGAVLAPVGHGSLLLGLALGFEALLAGGLIPALPRLVGIQAARYDPLYQAFHAGVDSPVPGGEGETAAAGVAIADPYHGQEVLAAVRRSRGTFLQVVEDQIHCGLADLARRGVYVELTSALVWDGLQQLQGSLDGPVIAVITGHGLKNP